MENLKKIIKEVLRSRVHTWHGQDVIVLNYENSFDEIADQVLEKLNQAEAIKSVCVQCDTIFPKSKNNYCSCCSSKIYMFYNR